MVAKKGIEICFSMRKNLIGARNTYKHVLAGTNNLKNPNKTLPCERLFYPKS